MDRDACLETVRDLTQSVVELFAPLRLASFTDDFAAFALTAGALGVAEKAELFRPRQALDTTLVAGMFFQVLVDAERLPADVPGRVAFVRKEAKQYLVQHLAGQVSLSQFYRLLTLIETNVQHYFERLAGDWSGRRAGPRETLAPVPEPVRVEELRRALAELPLPPKGRRITVEGLEAYLRDTQGRWFRLLDLESHFRVNKKTAWGYLRLLLKAGVLEHNGQKANRVRYAVAAPYRLAEGPLPTAPEI
jgi:hypothetical protein